MRTGVSQGYMELDGVGLVSSGFTVWLLISHLISSNLPSDISSVGRLGILFWRTRYIFLKTWKRNQKLESIFPLLQCDYCLKIVGKTGIRFPRQHVFEISKCLLLCSCNRLPLPLRKIMGKKRERHNGLLRKGLCMASNHLKPPTFSLIRPATGSSLR